MVVMLMLPLVVVIAGIAAVMRLEALQALGHRKETRRSTPSVPERSESVTPLPIRRPRFTETASRFRPMSAPANVKLLADYRKARARRVPPARVARGLPRGPRPHRPEPA